MVVGAIAGPRLCPVRQRAGQALCRTPMEGRPPERGRLGDPRPAAVHMCPVMGNPQLARGGHVIEFALARPRDAAADA